MSRITAFSPDEGKSTARAEERTDTWDASIAKLCVLPVEELASEPEQEDLEVLSFGQEAAQQGYGYIVGEVRNNTSRNYRYVQIAFDLIDDEGYSIGKAIANVNGLDAGATWKYKATILQQAGGFRLRKVIGY